MSVCMGYGYLTDQHCENSEGNCSQQFGCNNYSLTPLPETGFNSNHSKDYPESRGLMRQNMATNSWPCRFQKSCNYFDKNNPIISEYIRQMDVMALPPN